MSAQPVIRIKTRPEDFVVEELPAYVASGQGEHVLIEVHKVGWTTSAAAETIARAAGADPRAIGWAGQKDRHAVTTQTISVAYPIAKDLELFGSLDLPEGIKILSAKRHDNKLKPGHLLGNRFSLFLRVQTPDLESVTTALLALSKTGVPNRFGPQRFGRDGNNPAQAIAWVAGSARGPKNPRMQRMLFSSLQSAWFNDLLERRVQMGTWRTPLAGDVAKKTDTGGLFDVDDTPEAVADAEQRAQRGEICPTGPMFGAKMRWPSGAPGELERQVLMEAGISPDRLEALKKIGSGTRRPLLLPVDALTVDPAPTTPRGPDEPAGVETGIRVSFVLPKGGYATTVLAEVGEIVDCSHDRLPPSTAANDQPPVDPGDPPEKAE